MPAMAPPLLPPRPQATPFSKHFPPRHHHGPATPQGETASKPRRPATPHGEHPVRNLTAGARSATLQGEHPVEVIARVRNLTAGASSSALEVPSGTTTTVRVQGGCCCRDFSLDGVSLSEEEDLEGFYRRFVRSRIDGVRVGANCTVMVYGPTGSGKTHTMFGKQQQQQHGIVYRALRDLLDDGGGGEGEELGGVGLSVQLTMLEIYNDDIYDLLATPKVRLEVMGKKAKNATCLTGNEAGKISREVAEVEKRRTVKSTLCNERSSRSHFMIILDVPSVGGRLMLVDMAGSENIEAAGQTGFEAKMQTANINRANTALKRVVESIANGHPHVPFRDSKLTMLLQDSFEDDKSKILMILCASPDPKELHKTISTLEYGAKAKCIIRAAHASTPRDKMNSEESSSMLNSRIEAMNKLICKLQKENKQREKEHNEVLRQKEEELAQVRAKLWLMEGQGAAAKEEARILKSELQLMEEKMLQQELLADEAEKERIEAQTVLRHKEEELAQVRAKLRLMEGQGASAKEEAKVQKREELQMMGEKMVRQQQELLAPQQMLQEVEPEKLEAHNYILPQGVNLTMQVSEKINEKVQIIKSYFPIFVKVMSPTNLVRMKFSMKYASACLPEDNNQTMILRVEGKRKSWRTMLKVHPKYLVREIRDRGWKDFVTDNGVEAGDICLFELVETCTKSLTLKVHLIRRSEIDTQIQTKARSA